MDDTRLFAQECAEFFKKRMFTPNVKPEDLGLRIDAAVYLMAKNLLSDGPRVPTIEDMVMGTHGPTGGPHFSLLVDFLRDIKLPAAFSGDMRGL
jgi:hypothetical protein